MEMVIIVRVVASCAVDVCKIDGENNKVPSCCILHAHRIREQQSLSHIH